MRHGPFEREAKQYGARRASTVGRRASMVAMTLAATLLLGGCAATQDAVDWVSDTIGGGTAGSQQSVALPAPRYLSETPARTVTPRKRMQCVPYVRQISKVSIRGNAWTWWPSAKGQYGRGSKPKVGSVLVLKRTWRNRYGHIAVVTRILSGREIIIDHANWLNRGRLHLGTPVRDVSANNDWSAVRVWYTPGKKYGARSYPAHGFIYPEPPVAANSAQQGFLGDPAARPTGRPPAGLDLGNS
ncbi:MAG: CHAP domain-containing protein [Gemmatimonadetes bacterium]|nr:CHAP domain-containing protein [Gemmatimonadota bacterium]